MNNNQIVHTTGVTASVPNIGLGLMFPNGTERVSF